MMRLLKILIALGLIWSAWWYAAGYGLRRGISDWFAAQAARGWQADYASLSTSGYPLRHINLLTGPALADPATGAAWQADWISLESPAIWPGRQTLRFAPTAQRLSWFDRHLVITAAQMRADLNLRPGLSLGVERMVLTSGPWRIEAGGGDLLAGQSLVLSMVQGEDPATYRYRVEADGFMPGRAIRRLARATEGLPERFETMELDAQVVFDRPWDRRALEERRPQPVSVDLKLAELRWGELRLMAAGRVTVDGQGIPSGAITVKAENWRQMLAMAQAAGRLSPDAAASAERALGFLAGMGGNPRAIDVQLNLRDGFIALGPIPIGPAPRLILR